MPPKNAAGQMSDDFTSLRNCCSTRHFEAEKKRSLSAYDARTGVRIDCALFCLGLLLKELEHRKLG